jgi:hypothetical protein
MMSARSRLADMPILARSVVLGGACAGLVGGVIGFIVGLRAYGPTTWFAVFELGVPSAIAGAVAGLCVGVTTVVIRAVFRH